MRAVVLSEFGPPGNLAVAEVPDPVAGPGQVVVDVRIANITFVETQVRAGTPPNPAMLPRLPAVLGNGVGGVVTSPGAERRVITATGGSGGYAERALADAAALVDVPEELSMDDAVALLADGRTALNLVRAAQVRAGDTVLIEAAAGGVGSLLVQLARNAGARVVAAAGGPRKVAIADELGADVAVDYAAPGWEGRVREKVDVVFDGVGGQVGKAALGLLRDGGRFCAYGMASGSFTELPAGEAGPRVVRGAPLDPSRSRELTREVIAQATEGRLRPLIGQTFPLERAADAHAAIEARATVGKTLLVTR